MKNFYVYQNCVDIVRTDGAILRIFFNENSGKAYFRYKIGSLSKVKHTGIFIGTDVRGNSYFMHNHHQTGRLAIVLQQEFSKNRELFLFKIPEMEVAAVIENGLKEVARGERYDVLNYNCQTFVNVAFIRVRKSEDVSRIVGQIFFWTILVVGTVAIVKS
jgi:hypothetical protein